MPFIMVCITSPSSKAVKMLGNSLLKLDSGIYIGDINHVLFTKILDCLEHQDATVIKVNKKHPQKLEPSLFGKNREKFYCIDGLIFKRG